MKRSAPVLPLVFLFGCATLATSHDESTIQPSSGIGPFRKLTGTEVRGVAPFVLDDFVARYRDPDAITEADGSISLVAVAESDSQSVIVLTRSDDGRSFFGGGGDYSHTPKTILRSSLAWEGDHLASPSVVERGGERWVYYASEGGVGLARRVGGSWEKNQEPVLSVRGANAWETSVPSGVDAVVLADNSVRLFYSVGSSVGEASSTDGVHFTRVAEPVFSSSSNGIDAGGVADVSVDVHSTAGDRLLFTMLYTATDRAGTSSIGVAGRFGGSGAFERRESAVYAVGKGERAPTSVARGDLTFLYVTQTVDGSKAYPAVAAAVAPADRTLGSPAPFPESVEPRP